MPESAGPGVVHFSLFICFVGNIRNWQYNSFSILFLSIPAVGGPRLYGARQVGSGLYHTKVTMTCVASHCDSRNHLKVPFLLLGSKPAVGPIFKAQQGVNIYGC